MSDLLYSETSGALDQTEELQETLEELYQMLEALDGRTLQAINLVNAMSKNGSLDIDTRTDLSYALLDLMENAVQFKVAFLNYMSV